MGGPHAYRILCGATALAFVIAGLGLFATFFAYHAPGADPPIPTGPTGFYFAAFAGSAMLGWAGCLVAAVRRPELGRTIGTATAFALVMSASYRLMAWLVGDYYAFLGEAPRVEAGVFLLLALAFVWLRPSADGVDSSARSPLARPGVGGWLATAAIAILLALDLALPGTALGRRGTEKQLRADVAGAVGRVGERLPDLELPDLEGEPVRLADLRGRPVLITFERSLDW